MEETVLDSNHQVKFESAVNSIVEVLDALKEGGVEFNERAAVELEYAKAMLGKQTEAEEAQMSEGD
jgi:hypothetical protein